ncbi:MAG: hypothetical protein JSU01_03250 [Bacteroidetes bacterium]|nr:hypothetical protein [Bacteroidota bacterium]
MARTKIISVIISSMLFAACGRNLIGASNYPKLVDSLGVRTIFDDARWRMYCVYCDQVCDFATTYRANKFDDIDSLTFGQLTLKLDTIVVKHNDSIQIFMSFFYDTLRCNFTSNKREVMSGLAYKRGDSTPIYYILPGAYKFYDRLDTGNRLTKGLQPEVIKYIKENKDKIAPWFRKEAEKYGVFNDNDHMRER